MKVCVGNGIPDFWLCLVPSKVNRKERMLVKSSPRSKPQPPQICKPTSGELYNHEIKLRERSLPTFGPFYSKDESSLVQSRKNDAWNQVLENSPDREARTIEIYLGAVRTVEKQARETYADDDEDTVNNLTGSQFRWMMIKDGCFFLHLALFMLGGWKQLGYLPDDKIFGKKPNIRGWIKSIFLAGNQIPLVVLRELMKQSYFQQVIAQQKWEKPKADVCKMVLYQFILLPALENQQMRGILFSQLRGLIRRPLQQPPPPSDILHGLHILVVGPEVESNEAEDEEDEDDDEEEEDLEAQVARVLDQGGHRRKATSGHTQPGLEAQGARVPDQGGHRQEGTDVHTDEPMDDEYLVVNGHKDRKFSSAAQLRQTGIQFDLVDGKGTRGIIFTKFRASLGWPFVGFRASLTLPPLFVDQYTEIMCQSLLDYERIQSFCEDEVHSYLRFMSELIRTPEDAKLLAKRRIVTGKNRHKDGLPNILHRLALENLYNQHFRQVRSKVIEYSRPSWAYLMRYVEVVLLLTAVQTAYAIVAYHKPKK